LIAYKVQLENRKKDEQQLKKKVLAFHASLGTEDSKNEEEKIAMITRKFRKFLKLGKFKKNKKINDNPLCFKCNKPDHMKKDCLLLKPKGNFKSSNKFKKKKAFQAICDNSDLSSSDEEEITESANICFMAQEDKVTEFMDNNELLDAFNELFFEFKKISAKTKDLKKKKMRIY